ncbi:MAG: response regulator transcription factor [Terriglobia bacterium]
MAKQKKIRILIGDQRPVCRAGLRKLLAGKPEFTIVGEAEDERQLLKALRQLKPAVLLLESVLSGGIETEFQILREALRKQKNLRVVALTSSEKEDEAMRSVRRSLAAILPRHTPFSVLAECVRRVAAGEAWPDAPMAAAPGNPAGGLFAPGSHTLDASPLSEREKQVVELISQGFKNKEIAERMFISEQTVKNHLHNIFDKLGVSDRLELALYAIHKNLQAVS